MLHIDYLVAEQYKVWRIKIDGNNAEKIKDIAKVIARLTWVGKRDRTVRLTALNVLKEAGVKGGDWIGEAVAVMKWIQNNFRYTLDPQGMELFQTPRRTIIDKSGDCDDLSILYAAMMASIGHRSAVILTNPKGIPQITHAMGSVNFCGRNTPYGCKWISVELTKPKPFGWMPPKSTIRIIIPVPK